MKVLVLGASGLLGSACMKAFKQRPGISVVGTYREKFNALSSDWKEGEHYFLPDVLDKTSLKDLFKEVRPDIAINCVSISKTEMEKSSAEVFISIYSLLPHIIEELCAEYRVRFIQISSDGVFSGTRGNYSETDTPDATDLYGKSKFLGEVSSSHSLTLRTSMIGHSPMSHNGLITWFLQQEGSCSGYPSAIFSGFPVNVIAEVIRDYVFPKEKLSGIYHLASSPISKFELLSLVAKIYAHPVSVVPDTSVKLDRSLNGEKFAADAQYYVPSWVELVRSMHVDYYGH